MLSVLIESFNGGPTQQIGVDGEPASQVEVSFVGFVPSGLGDSLGAVTYVQETAPTGGITAGSQWLQTSTGRVRRFYSGAWQDAVLDGQYF